MEARSTLQGASVSKAFVAAVLVLVAMGLGAMGGYVAKGIGATGTSAIQSQVHAAPGTVLRQDNPAQVQVHPAPGTVIRQDNPVQAADSASIRSTSRGDHGDLQ